MKRFCKNQVETKENSEGNDCLIHLLEGGMKEIICPYIERDIYLEESQSTKPSLYISKTIGSPLGRCRDFEPTKDQVQKFKRNYSEISSSVITHNPC